MQTSEFIAGLSAQCFEELKNLDPENTVKCIERWMLRLVVDLKIN
jgi:hypothetical protein